MNPICIQHVADVIGGRLSMGTPPPLAGDMEPIGRIQTDIECLNPGDLYWSLSTAVGEAACRAWEAFSRGAAGIVSAGHPVEPWAGRYALQVEDALWALWQLAGWSRDQFNGRLIAVCGDTGKSTSSSLIRSVLGRCYTCAATSDEQPDRLQLPLALAQLASEHDYAVVEYHGRKKGEIRAVSHLCRAEIAVINSIANQRGSSEDFDQHTAVVELMEQLPSDGWAVINGDMPGLRGLSRGTAADVMLVGRGSHNDLVASDVRCEHGQLSFAIEGQVIRLAAAGRHMLPAALSAYAVGRISSVPANEMVKALSEWNGLPRRCQISSAEDITMIDDSYDNRHASWQAALKMLSEFEPANRRLVVSGGKISKSYSNHVGREIVSLCGADWLITYGEDSVGLAHGARAAGMPTEQIIGCRDMAHAHAVISELVTGGDVLLVKTAGDSLGQTFWNTVLQRESSAA